MGDLGQVGKLDFSAFRFADDPPGTRSNAVRARTRADGDFDGFLSHVQVTAARFGIRYKDSDLGCIFSRIVWFGTDEEGLPRIVELGPSPMFQPAAVIGFSDVQDAVPLFTDQLRSCPA
jgi:hypothetical protein